MLKATRPLFQQVLKASTGLTGLPVRPNPLPDLRKTLESTLQRLSSFPESSVYRQATTTLTQRTLDIVERSGDDVASVERALDAGQIEVVLKAAEDELSLASKMVEWKAWEPLEEHPIHGQWDYFGKATSPS